MIEINGQDELFTRYFLGELTEQERTRLEEDYFTDDNVFERFLVVKGELLDAYARGGLAEPERELFEQHYLSTGPRRQRLSEATELIEFSTQAAVGATITARQRAPWKWPSFLPVFINRRPVALEFALATVLVVVALGGLWAFFKSAEPRDADRVANMSTAIDKPSEPRSDSASLPGKDGVGAAFRTPPDNPPLAIKAPVPGAPARRLPTAARVATVLLSPVLTRDTGRASTLIIRPGTSAARVRLGFKDGDYSRYIVVLQTVEGEGVWRGAAHSAKGSGAGGIVVVKVPARVFRRKDYIITLSGVTAEGVTKEINEYFLTVRKD